MNYTIFELVGEFETPNKFETERPKQNEDLPMSMRIYEDMSQVKEVGLLKYFMKYAFPGKEVMKLVRGVGSFPRDERFTAKRLRDLFRFCRTWANGMGQKMCPH